MLTINEIFYSIQGESTLAGEPCVFVRLTACDLRCSWCDTPYAFHEGRKMSIDEVLAEVDRHGCPLVEITGGEPLLQDDVYPLMDRLLEAGRRVMLETGGHRSIARVPAAVLKVVDVKCPDSGEADTFEMLNLEALSQNDEIKFVLSTRRDYEFAREFTLQHNLRERVHQVLFSPVFEGPEGKWPGLEARKLVQWMLEDSLPVRLGLQLHKFVWDPATKGV